MLNYIWAGMILVGILYAVLTGNIEAVTDAVLSGAGEGISLCITMAGVVAFWMGLMEIAKEVGCKAIIGHDVHNPKHLSEMKYLEYGKDFYGNGSMVPCLP